MASAPHPGVDAEIDHLVWATPNLEEGVSEIREIFSTEPVPGGSHPGLGTRNALLGLERQQYFEVLAPDPNQSQFRSFGRWMEGVSASGLLSWAGRSSNLEALAEAAARSDGLEPGKIESMSRRRPDGSSLSWKLMMVDGHDFGRLVPFFIEWADFHPSQSLQPVASLESMQLSTPNPRALEGILKTLGMQSASIHLVEAEVPGLTAELSVGGRRIRIR